LPTEAIAIRRIKGAARFAEMVGFAAGAAISVASLTAVTSAISTMATGLLSAPITVPALAISLPVGAAALIAEVGLVVYIQLHLAYDLFVLYHLPIDLDDPEQMQEVVGGAFDIKSAELTGQALQKIIPQLAPQLLRKVARTSLVRRKVQEWIAKRLTWQFARKYFGEGVIIRALVPGIAIVTATGWDYYSTSAIGKTLQAKIRRRGLAAKGADKLDLTNLTNPRILLQSVLALALTDDDLSETELVFYSRLVERLRNFYGDEIINDLQEVASLDWEMILVHLAEVTDKREQQIIFKSLLAAAIVEGQLQRKKQQRLKRLAKLYNLSFDEKKVRTRISKFSELKPTRTCLIIILMLFVLIIISCGICFLSLGLPMQ